MALQQETRRGGNLDRVSVVSFRGDRTEVTSAPLVVHRLARRIGCGAEVAALVAQLAGLGPRDGAR